MLARLPESFEQEQDEVVAAWKKDDEGLDAFAYFYKHISPEFRLYLEARNKEISKLKAQGWI